MSMSTRWFPALPAALALLVALLVALTGLPVPAAQASTPPAAPVSGLQQVGRGQLTWLGFRVYEASLWSPDGRWAGFEPGRPVALSLAYQRRFSREELIRITAGEWARLGLADEPLRRRWASALASVWQDVATGDSLTAVVVPGAATRFYDAQRLLGVIDDPAFGPAYLSIWLDPRSAVRDLRGQLLNLDAR
jgi:hypothetical protein